MLEINNNKIIEISENVVERVTNNIVARTIEGDFSIEFDHNKKIIFITVDKKNNKEINYFSKEIERLIIYNLKTYYCVCVSSL